MHDALHSGMIEDGELSRNTSLSLAVWTSGDSLWPSWATTTGRINNALLHDPVFSGRGSKWLVTYALLAGCLSAGQTGKAGLQVSNKHDTEHSHTKASFPGSSIASSRDRTS
ncbi:hypothetical protein ACJZ2D_009566 [Fusarium nematophilum]